MSEQSITNTHDDDDYMSLMDCMRNYTSCAPDNRKKVIKFNRAIIAQYSYLATDINVEFSDFELNGEPKWLLEIGGEIKMTYVFDYEVIAQQNWSSMASACADQLVYMPTDECPHDIEFEIYQDVLIIKTPHTLNKFPARPFIDAFTAAAGYASDIVRD